MNRDIYQKIASLSDDKTALSILSSVKEMNKDIHYLAIFGNCYPDLIKYRKKDESIKKLYLRSLEIIGKLKEQFDYTYVGGNPELQLKIFKESGGEIDRILTNAARKGDLELIKYVVEKGVNIHAVDDAALGLASGYGHLEVVKYLVGNGADIHANNDFALRWASGEGHLEVVKYLVEQGANVHAYDGWPLKKARRKEHLEVVEYLTEQMKNK